MQYSITSYFGNLDGTAQTEDGQQVTMEDILIFFTGACKEPPLGFGKQPMLLFEDGELATASTCDLKIRLPLKHETYERFKDFFLLSLKGHDGLGVA